LNVIIDTLNHLLAIYSIVEDAGSADRAIAAKPAVGTISRKFTAK
jgi:hypothetical protein